MRRTACASVLAGLLAAPTLPSPGGAAPLDRALPTAAHLTQAPPEQPAAVHSWANLSRVDQGDRIIVITRRSRVLEGQFLGYTSDTLTFTVDNEPVSIDRDDVAEVQWREKSHKVRNAVLTLGVSVLVGWIAGMGAEASADPDQASQTASSMSLEAGAATNEALPKYAVIYRAPAPSTD